MEALAGSLLGVVSNSVEFGSNSRFSGGFGVRNGAWNCPLVVLEFAPLVGRSLNSVEAVHAWKNVASPVCVVSASESAGDNVSEVITRTGLVASSGRRYGIEVRTRKERGLSKGRNAPGSKVCDTMECNRNIMVMAQSETASPESTEGISMNNFSSVKELKTTLLASLEGLNRGIFGVQNARKLELESLLRLLEAVNPSPRPTDNLDKVKGQWRLLYSTISILGSKRTKLGLRDFINLGDFLQSIDVDQGKAVNEVSFSVAGLGMLSGSFTIEASYNIVSPTRVDIKFEHSSLVPEQLLSLFQKNYDLLLSIFNPEGWLEITYIDDTLRIGRDDKGNVFLLERM